MATRLYPHQGSQNVDRNSIKIKIDCIASNPESNETKDWLDLLSKFKHDTVNIKVYKALLDKSKNIVAKIGKYDLKKEYDIAKILETLKMPTFITVNCIFSCLDNFSELKNNAQSVCQKKGEPVSIIIMPYISEGRIDLWKWERSNFDLMKNVIKHTFLSLFYAKQKVGFIHGDLHLGNVLLKKSNRKEISYGDFGTFEVSNILPVIMDFDKSTLVEKYDRFLYMDLSKFISLMSNSCNVKINFNKLLDELSYLENEEVPISKVIYNNLCNIIDKSIIRSVDSEKPPMPNWLKPQRP